MAAPAADIAAEWLLEEADNLSFRPLKEVLTRALQFRLRDSSPEELAEYAERLSSSVMRELQTRAAEDKAEGISAAFEISGESDSAYFRLLGSPEVPLLQKLRGLDPKRFEEVCAEILIQLGAKAHTIGGSADQGVDFRATNLQLGEYVKFAPRSSQAMVIGQAKRWNGKNITETMMREFVGGAVLHAQRIRISLTADAGVLTPVIFAYWTTSDFHHLARKYAREMGIWYLNGVGLAQLADRAGIKLDEL